MCHILYHYKRANSVIYRFLLQDITQSVLLLTSLFFSDRQCKRSNSVTFKSDVIRNQLIHELSFAWSRLIVVVSLPYRKTQQFNTELRVFDKDCKTGANEEKEPVSGTGEIQTRNLGQGKFIIVSLSIIRFSESLKGYVKRIRLCKTEEIKETQWKVWIFT